MNDLHPSLLHPAPGAEDLERRQVDAVRLAVLAERRRCAKIVEDELPEDHLECLRAVLLDRIANTNPPCPACFSMNVIEPRKYADNPPGMLCLKCGHKWGG